MDNTNSMDHVEFTDRRSLPMMALRGLTVFPGMMLTFEVERSMSVAALNMAMSDDQIIYLVPQIDIATDIPTPEDVYGVGTVCRIKQMMKQPGSKTVRVMAEGIERGRTLAVRTDMPCFVAEVEPMPDVAERKTARIEALIRHCCNLFDAYVTVSGNMAPESVITVLGSTNAGFVSNFIAQHVFLRPEQKQELLEQTRPSRRLTLLSKMLLHETSVLGLQHQLEEAAQEPDAAGVSAARADEDHSGRARRGGRPRLREHRLSGEDPGAAPAGGIRAAPAQGSRPTQKTAVRLVGGVRHPQLSGCLPRAAVEHPHRGTARCARCAQGAR